MLLPNPLKAAPKTGRVPMTGGSNGGFLSQLSGGTNAGAGAAMAAYGQTGGLFAIVNRIAEATAAIEWTLNSQTTNKEDVTLVDTLVWPAKTPFTALWLKPNIRDSGNDFRFALQQYLDLVGEFWIVKYRPSPGALPAELWPIRPDRMEPVPDRDGYILGYIYTIGREKIPLEIEDVIFKRIPNPLDPYRGLGAVQSMMADLEGEAAAAAWNRNFFRNSAEPGGVVMIDHNMDDVEFERFVTRWRESHQGMSNTARVAFLEKATYQPANYTQRDMQFEGLRRFNRDQMLFAFGLHGSIMGVSENVNLANALSGETSFSRWLLRPRAERLKEAFNADLVVEFGDNLMIDYIDPTPANRTENTTTAIEVWSSGLATKNEARMIAGMDAIEGPGGDEFIAAPAQSAAVPQASIRAAVAKSLPAALRDIESDMSTAWEPRLKQLQAKVLEFVDG